MNDEPLSDDDDLEFDIETLRRVRAALRDVPPQHPDEATRARRAALSHVITPRRPRQPAWLIVAAAGVVGILAITVLNRSGGGGGGTGEMASPAQVVAELEAAASESRLAPTPMAAGAPASVDDLVLWVRANRPVASAICPIEGAERSYGERRWNDADVEVLVDDEQGTVRVVDVATCATLATATLAP